MILEEVGFTEIYHKYQVFEVDALTDVCKDVVDVTINDCFMLTTTFIDNTGELQFAVLAIGPDSKNCTKGLELLAPLKVISSFEMIDYEFEIVERPTFEMQVKGAEVFESENCSPELAVVRRLKEVDDSRDIHYPDVLTAKFLESGRFHDYLIESKEYNSKFIEGTLLKEPEHDIGFHKDEVVEVVAILYNNQTQLISVNATVKISDETFEKLREYVNEILDEHPEIGKERKS